MRSLGIRAVGTGFLCAHTEMKNLGTPSRKLNLSGVGIKQSDLFNKNTLLTGGWDFGFTGGVNSKRGRGAAGRRGRIQWLKLRCGWQDRVNLSD